jgi:ascorbate-specific PTS system EIIC-type component UlaA
MSGLRHIFWLFMRFLRLVDLHYWKGTYGVEEFIFGDEIGGVDGCTELEEVMGMLEIIDFKWIEEGVT